MSTRRGRSGDAAASATPSPVKASPVKSARATRRSSAAGEEEEGERKGGSHADAFDFEADDAAGASERDADGDARMHDDSSERKGAGRKAGKAAAAAGTPKKGAAAAHVSPHKATRASRGESKSAEEREVEAEDAEAERRAQADLEAEYATPMPRGGGAAGALSRRASSLAAESQASGAGGLSKDEVEKLMDAKKLKEVMGSKEELLKRLKKLALALGNQPQRTDLSARMTDLAGALVDRAIVKNKSAEVRALAACCIADLFRIFAPNVPFSDEQLKVVFDLILSLLANLSQPTHADFSRYFFLLESLVNVQFANVLANRSSESDLTMQHMFELFFSLAKHDLNSSILSHFVVIMGDLCVHCDPLPAVLLDEVLRQLTPEAMAANEKGAELAIQLINKYAMTFERPIQQFLLDTLVHKAEGEDLSTGITERMDHLSILLQVHAHCSSVLRTWQRHAAHLIETKDDEEREEMTDLFAQIFVAPELSRNAANAAHFFPLFEVLVNRFRDTHTRPRVRIAQQAGALLVAYADLDSHVSLLLDRMTVTLEDKEDAVRAAVISSFRDAGLANSNLLSYDIINAIGERCIDKKLNVRRAALNCLGDLFAAHCGRYWRVGQGAPNNTYRAIPKRLVLACKLDIQATVYVDNLLDERILGSDVSLEERTRCLAGVYMALVTRRTKGKSMDGRTLTPEEEAAAAATDETDVNIARHAFKDRLFGMKVRMHTTVRALLDLQAQASKSASSDELDRRKMAALRVLASCLHHDPAESEDEIVTSLHSIFFEAKDRNVAKYLRVLSNPLTAYQQIRLAQEQLVMSVRALSANKEHKSKRGVSFGILASRMASMLSMAVVPMESIELLFQEMHASQAQAREPLFRSCQELLILVADTFPALLTHPNTIRTLHEHLALGRKRGSHAIVDNVLAILSKLRDPAPMHEDASAAADFLADLRTIAVEPLADQAQLAVECIHHLWRAPSVKGGVAGAASSATKYEHADVILGELLTLHCAENLSLESDCLESAFACAAKIAQLDYELFHSRVDERTQLVRFARDHLFPAADTVGLMPARIAALSLMQHDMAGAAQRPGTKEDVFAAPESVASKEDPHLSPRNWLIILLKILKLDGRFPVLDAPKGGRAPTTAQQLQQVMEEQETDEEEDARLQFLLHTSHALLQLATLKPFHHFFVHVPPSPVYVAPAATTTGSLLSPKLAPSAAAAANSPSRHQWSLPPLAYMAMHPNPNVSKLFMQRVIQLLDDKKLPFALWHTVLVLGCKHPEKAFREKLQHTLELLVHATRRMALGLQHRHEAMIAQQEARQAAERASPKKKKGRGRKSAAAAEAEEEEAAAHELEERRQKVVANSMFPEYALTDLLYMLSYHPKFQARLPANPTQEQKDAVFAEYDSMLDYIEFFLGALLHDSIEHGGGNFSLMFSLMTRIREHEDVRNPYNVKLYKLQEITHMALQHRSALHKWSTVSYESQRHLSQYLFRLRREPLSSDTKHIGAGYKPHLRVHVAKEAGSEPATPKRKKKEGGETPTKARRGSVSSVEGEEEGEEAEGGSARKKPRASGSAKKKILKEEATPTRSRLSRGAKEGVTPGKYTVDDVPEDVDEDESAVAPVRSAARKSTSHAKEASEEESEAEAEQEEEEEDVDMTRPQVQVKSRRASGSSASKAAASAKGSSSSARKSSPRKRQAESDEEEAEADARMGAAESDEDEEAVAQAAASIARGGKGHGSSAGGGSASKGKQRAADQPSITGFLNGKGAKSSSSKKK